MGDNRFYVYFLIDSRNNKPFYVGKGTRGRTGTHLCEAKKPEGEWINALKCRRINAIWESGGEIIIKKIKEELLEQEAYDLESKHIKEYGQLILNTGILTNIITEDGIHPRRYKKVDQYTLDGDFIRTYDSVQEAASVAGVVENTMSGVINERVDRKTNKTMRTAGGFRWTHHGKDLPQYDRYEAIYKKKFKKVVQFTLTGEHIRTFDSAKQATEITGVSQQGICKVSKNTLTTAGGYCWAYEGDLPRLPNLKDKRYGTKNN